MLGVNSPTLESINDELSSDVWVFGYGSLTWKPDFQYEEKHIGYIQGFARRFWQGSTWHRGNENTPGRVVTLVKEKQSQVWGIAFKVNKQNHNQVLEQLNHRETILGGYEIHQETFHPNTPSNVIPVVIYVATEANALFMGQESTDTLAQQIVRAHGQCGPNVEYLFRLVDFMKEHAPTAQDDHLFHIDSRARILLGLPVDRVIPWDDLVQQNLVICQCDSCSLDN